MAKQPPVTPTTMFLADVIEIVSRVLQDRRRKPTPFLCLVLSLTTWACFSSANAQSVVWQKFLYSDSGSSLGMSAYTSARALPALDSKYNPIIFGGALLGDFSSEAYVIKLSSADGSELWRHKYAGGYSPAGHISVDATDNIYALGTSIEGARLIKFNGTTGAIIWQQDFNRSTDGMKRDTGGHLVLDGRGSVYISTTSYRPTTGYTGMVAKFDAGSGALLWDIDLGLVWSHGGAMVADSAGDVFITSEYLDEPNNKNWQTTKLSRLDGSTLWRKTVDGTDHQYDVPTSIGIDGAGNVVVTGSTNERYNGTPVGTVGAKTIKYAGIDGSIIWETNYANFSYPAHLKIDASGDVIVAGSTRIEYRTMAKILKHAGASGDILWETIGAPFDMDYSAIDTIAIDGNGQIVTGGAQSVIGDNLVFRRFSAATAARTSEVSLGYGRSDPKLGISVGGSYSYLAGDGWDAPQYGGTAMVVKLRNGPATPSAPRNLSGTPGNANIALAFSPPVSIGGAPITQFKAQCMPGNIVASAPSTPIRVNGLANGTSYNCSVGAVNALGVGELSSSVTVTPSFPVPLALVGVSSRMTHGMSGDFDLEIDYLQPTSGTITIEPRKSVRGHRIVFAFNDTVTSGYAAITDAMGVNIPGVIVSTSYSLNELIATISGLADNVRARVSTKQVNGTLDVSSPVGFLRGDINASGRVTASDVASIKARIGANIGTGNNYLFDLNLSGKIDAADTSMAKASTGRRIPQ